MVYTPGEDSYLLKKEIEQLELEGKKCLDMGTGTGVLALYMAEKGAEVTAVDVDPEAVKYTEKRAEERDLEDSVTVLESDLFKDLNEGPKFDLAVFNPPYLPGKNDLEGGKVWKGGEKGIEITEIFLESVDPYLKDGGSALVVLSSRSDIEKLISRFDLETERQKSVGFEELYIAKFG